MTKLIFKILFILIAATSIPAQTNENVNKIGDFSSSSSFSINQSGYIYISDRNTNEIYKYDTLGNQLNFIGGYGWNPEAFDYPADIYATTLNVYVTDKNNHRIQFFDKDLNYLSELSSSNISDQGYTFSYPIAAEVSNQGDLFILDSDNERVLKFDLNGNFLVEIGSLDAGKFRLSDPVSMAVSANNNVYVLEKNDLVIFDQFGTGVFKRKLNFAAVNINITYHYMTINSDTSLYVSDLTLPDKNFVNITPDLPENIRIVEASIYNNRLYILTKKSIYIFNYK